MNIYVNYRNLLPRTTQLEFSNNSSLSVTTKDMNGDLQDQITYDLQDIINKYSEDHGCIALCVQGKRSVGPIATRGPTIMWHETTRISYPYRTPMGKSYSSLYEDNYSINTSANTSGAHNIASPAWALTEVGNWVPLLFILTPYANCTVDEAIFIYHDTKNPDSLQVEVDIDGKKLDSSTVTEMKSIKEFLQSWLPITFAVSQTSKKTTFTVTADTQANIYLNSNAGVLNRSVAKSGQVVTLNTDGLSSGEEVTVKAGYKFYPNISKTVITV